MISVVETDSILLTTYGNNTVDRRPIVSDLVRTIRISSYVDDQISVDFDDVVLTYPDNITVTTNDDGYTIVHIDNTEVIA